MEGSQLPAQLSALAPWRHDINSATPERVRELLGGLIAGTGDGMTGLTGFGRGGCQGHGRRGWYRAWHTASQSKSQDQASDDKPAPEWAWR